MNQLRLAYLGAMSFAGMSFDEALRFFLTNGGYDFFFLSFFPICSFVATIFEYILEIGILMFL